MRKRILSILCVLAILLCYLPIPASADVTDDADQKYYNEITNIDTIKVADSAPFAKVWPFYDTTIHTGITLHRDDLNGSTTWIILVNNDGYMRLRGWFWLGAYQNWADGEDHQDMYGQYMNLPVFNRRIAYYCASMRGKPDQIGNNLSAANVYKELRLKPGTKENEWDVIRDYFLYKFFVEVGLPSKVTDYKKCLAIAEAVQALKADTMPVTNALRGIGEFSDCKTIQDIYNKYIERAVEINKQAKEDEQNKNSTDPTQAAKTAFGDLYNFFEAYCARSKILSNTDMTNVTKYLDPQNVERALGNNYDTFKSFQSELVGTGSPSTIDSEFVGLYVSVLQQSIACSGVKCNLTEMERYELLTIPFTRGHTHGFALNGAAHSKVTTALLAQNGTLYGQLSGDISPDAADAATLLFARQTNLDKNKNTDEQTECEKTLGPRFTVTWALSDYKDHSTTVKNNGKDVDLRAALAHSLSVDNTQSGGASTYYAFPESAYFDVLNSVTKSDSRSFSAYNFDDYVQLKNMQGEMTSVAMEIDIGLKSTIAKGSATAGQKVLFQELEDIKQLVTDANTMDKNPVLVNELNYFWTTRKLEQQQMSLSDLEAKLSGVIEAPTLDEFATDSNTEPLRNFINLDQRTVQKEILTGMKLSATFIPFKTNMYDANTFRLVAQDDAFLNFQALYGYNRKAVYIDTNINSVTAYYNDNGKMGSSRVCTLKDLLECEKEIQLYSDGNYYNAAKLQAYKDAGVGTMDNAAGADNTKSGFAQLWDNICNVFKFNIFDVLKTGGKTNYRNELSDIDSYAKTQNGILSNTDKEQAIFSGKQIDQYINTDNTDADYNLMRAFAFTSSVYRSNKLFTLCAKAGVQPIFQASKNTASITMADARTKDALYNYALLKNIDKNRNVNYTSNLDYDKPIYLDVYGNILTESGYVVVPAAANATIFNKYSMYTAAWLTTYGQSYSIESTYTWPGESECKDMMVINDKTPKIWSMAAKAVGDVDYNRLATSSDEAMNELMSLQVDHLSKDNLCFDNYVRNVFLEVMRGAPLEDIDKTAEGLNVSMRVSRAGIIQASKLDSLKQSLKSASQNTVLALPNLAFVDGLEYYVLFIYKLSLIICIGMLLIQIFLKAMQGKFGLWDVLKMFCTIALTIMTIFAIPKMFDVSYYESNRLLLQKEAQEVSILNLEKKESGMEIGITSVGAPDINTKLYVKMKDVHIPWYDAFYKIVTSPISKSLSGIYADYASNDPAFSESQFKFTNGGLYVGVDQLYDSADLVFNPTYKTLIMTTPSKTPASFYSPYYVFLQTLTSRVNNYNFDQGVYSYSTETFSGGKVKSLGLSKDYFSSDYFIDKDAESGLHDILDLTTLYGKATNTQEQNGIFTADEIAVMRKSQWLDADITGKDLSTRIDLMDKEARDFVASNKDLLGRVSDETFIKAMSLDLALKFNQIFNIGCADCLEIYNLSQDDIMRFAIAPPSEVIKGSPLSYTRFVYLNGGESAVYAAGLLEVVTFVSGWVKPIATIFIMLAIFISLFIYKIILGKKTESFKGYILLMIALCSTNILYSVLLKASMSFPQIGMPCTICIILQVVLQIIFLCVFGLLTGIVVVNWRDLGATKFTALGIDVKNHFEKHNIIDRIRDKAEKHSDDKRSGWRVYHQMQKTDEARKYNSIEEDDEL